MHEKNSDNPTKQFENIFLKINKSTDTIFRTTYYIVKNNRPFVSDHSKLLELQYMYGINTGITFLSQFSCTQIISHISMKMKDIIVSDIVKSGSKISFIIDESTTLSALSAMVEYIKTSISSKDLILIWTFLSYVFKQQIISFISLLIAYINLDLMIPF